MLRYFYSFFCLLFFQTWFGVFDIQAQIISPNQIANLTLWLRADTLVTTTGNDVIRWGNCTGLGADFVQPDAAKRPQLVNNEWNGKPVVRFSESNFSFLTAYDAYDPGYNNRTVFIIGKATNADNTYTFYAKALSAAAPNRFALFNNAGDGLRLLVVDKTSTPSWVYSNINSQAINIWSNTINRVSSEMKLYRNGMQVGSTATANIPAITDLFDCPYRFLLGAYNGGTDDLSEALHLEGDIAEMIIYDGLLTDNERNQIERYLGAKYSPQVNLGMDITLTTSGLCSITLDAGAGLTAYKWSTLDTTQQISVSAPGTYWVTALDNFGYQSTDTIKVAFTSIPDTILCPGSVLSIGTGLAATYSFLWSTSDSTPSINIDQPGIYSVTITDTLLSCSQRDTFIVTLDSFAYKVSLGADTQVCKGNFIGLVSGSQLVVSYSWSPPAQTPTIATINPGNYSVTVTDSYGCTASDTVFVAISGVAPATDFRADTACLGEATNFFDQSSVDSANIVSWLWEFGGGNTDTTENPSFIFLSPGDHPVTLTAGSDSGCKSTITKTVTVIANPVARFVLQSNACINNNFNFTDSSTADARDSITIYHWSFGDGDTSASPNPSHVYDTAGDKIIVLNVTTRNGCTASYSDTLFVDSTAQLPGVFSLIAPVNNYVALPGATGFSWTASSGAFDYTLEIASDYSFTNLLDSAKNIAGLNHSLILRAGNYYWRVRAFNICGQDVPSEIRYLSVINLSSLGTFPLWLRADSLVQKNPQTNEVDTWVNCTRNGQDFIQTNPFQRPKWVDNVLNGKPVIRFTSSNRNFLTSGRNSYNLGFNSRTVFLVAKATDSTGYSFYSKSVAAIGESRFGFFNNDPQTGTRAFVTDLGGNPLFVESKLNLTTPNIWSNTIDRNSQVLKLYRNSGQSGVPKTNVPGPSYSFVSQHRFLLGAFNGNPDTLNSEVLYLNGDIAEMIIYDDVLSDSVRNQVEQYLRFKYAPQINIGPDIEIGYGVCDTALRAGNFANLRWSTGETTQTIRIKQSGTYWVTAHDIFGYTTTDTAEVNIPYKGTNVGDSTVICLGDSVQLIQQISPLSAYSILWQGGDTVNSIYVSAEGSYSATITDTIGCVLLADPVFVDVDSFQLHSLLDGDTTMCAGNNIAVYPYQYPYVSYLWSNPDTNFYTTPMITVDSGGTYWMTVTNINACVASDTIAVRRRWYAPLTDFNAGNVCDGVPVVFDNQTDKVGDDSIRVWNWDFGDDSSSNEADPSHLYISTGKYGVTLTLITDSGCTGLKTDTVSVFPVPEARISYNPEVICAGTTVVFNDETPDFPPIERLWLFNNIDSFVVETLTYTFPDQGTVPLLFIANTDENCADTISEIIEIFPELKADFNFSKVCFGDSTEFTDLSSSLSILSWKWTFGDGSFFSSLQHPKRKYQQADTFDVELVVTNSIGCVDTAEKRVKIVALPVPIFTDANACEGFYYSPMDSSISLNDTIGFWTWVIDSTTYTGRTPQHFFDEAGSYPVVLTVETKTGACTASTTRVVTIDPNPVALFGMSPLYGEAPLEVTFNNQTTNAVSYFWDFGDNAFSDEKNPSHTYLQNGTYEIKLIALSNALCTDSFAKTFIVIPTELDLSIDEVIATPVQQADGSVSISITVNMSNVGSRIITSAKLYAILGSGGLITEDWTDSLPMLPGQRRTYTFHAQFVALGERANSYICVEAKSVNDGETEARTDNNRQCTTLTGTIQLIGPSPNPVLDQSVLGIILPKAGKLSIAIVNALGQYVLDEVELSFPEGRSDFAIPAHRMSAAEYFIRIIYNDEKFIRKFVVRR